MLPVRRIVTCAVACAGLLVASTVGAEEESLTWLPGSARLIPRTTSASRDTPALEFAFGPKAQGSLGAEFGILEKQWREMSLRFGMYGMIALENDTEEIIFPREYWRGLVGFSLAYSPDALARAWFGKGSAIELGVVFGHESDHHTDAPLNVDELAYSLYGQLNFLQHDIALRVPMGGIGDVSIRFLDRLFAGSGYSHAPGFDLHVRFRPLEWLNPVVSVFGEHYFASAEGADCYFGRAMTGIAFVGVFGELTPFASFDAGCRKGLLFERREAAVSGGFRYAPF